MILACSATSPGWFTVCVWVLKGLSQLPNDNSAAICPATVCSLLFMWHAIQYRPRVQTANRFYFGVFDITAVTGRDNHDYGLLSQTFASLQSISIRND